MVVDERVSLRSVSGRLLLAATIMASGMAFLDGTVVNVALPHIEADLGGGLPTVQWVLDAYLLMLGSLVLVGGSLGDLLGKRRVFVVGVVAFVLASVVCGLAPSAHFLIGARALQGVAAALLVPTSLALVSGGIVEVERGRAIGLWTGLTSVVMVLGPFVGGLLVDSGAGGWRWIFLVNVPLGIAVLIVARGIPRGSRPAVTGTARRVDAVGAVLVVVGLALLVGPMIEAHKLGVGRTVALIVAGVVLLVAFTVVERRRARDLDPPPMLPPSLWHLRSFTIANVATLLIYGALGAFTLVLSLGLQIGLGYSATAAGAATVPIPIILGLLSGRMGALLPRVGTRLLIGIGTLILAASAGLLVGIEPGWSYPTRVLGPLVVFAVGLAMVVAPITSTALGDVPADRGGIASGVNNAVARVGGLVAVAVVPVMAGLTLVGGQQTLAGVSRSMLLVAGVCLLASLVTWVGFTRSTGRVAAVPGA